MASEVILGYPLPQQEHVALKKASVLTYVFLKVGLIQYFEANGSIEESTFEKIWNVTFWGIEDVVPLH